VMKVALNVQDRRKVEEALARTVMDLARIDHWFPSSGQRQSQRDQMYKDAKILRFILDNSV
jgi:hypothetical protein